MRVRTFALVLTFGVSICGAFSASAAAQTNAATTDASATSTTVEAPTTTEADATKRAPGPRKWRDACRFEDSDWRGAGVPTTPVYEAQPDGACFCSLLGTRATRASKRNTFGAWVLGTAAAGLLLAGPVIGGSDDGSLWDRERGTLLALSGAALAPIAYYLWLRSERASSASARASQAQSDAEATDDRDLYRACVAANADWITSREASLSVGNITLDRLRRTAAEAEAAAEQAKKDAQESLENAEVANKAAEQAQQSAESVEATREETAEPEEETEARKPAAKRPAAAAREQP